MANNIDDSDFLSRLDTLDESVTREAVKAMELLGNELMRLSAKEVPIHTVPGEPGGALQNSGFVDIVNEGGGDEVVVGYNIVYAAYQHEGRRKDGSHVVKQYTNARSKPKFLEDPIKNNMELWGQLFFQLMAKAFQNGTHR